MPRRRGRSLVHQRLIDQHRQTTDDTAARQPRFRRAMLALVGVRLALGVIVFPLAPALWNDHFLWVVVMRPTKEVLLFGGFLARRGDQSALTLVLVALPLVITGVWVFYGLGRAYREQIANNDLGGWAGRLLKPKRIHKMQRVLEHGGAKVVFLGRLAAFPSSVMAAAAGASNMDTRTFLIADLLGALVSIAEVVIAGYALGHTYEKAGPWITAVGALLLVGLVLLLGRYLKREGQPETVS